MRVYYRRDRADVGLLSASQAETDGQNADSGHGSMAQRRSTPLSQTQGGATTTTTTNLASPYSTLGKSYATEHGVDLLHDKWADLMDQYLDNKFKSNAPAGAAAAELSQDVTSDDQKNTMKRSHVIKLNDPNLSNTIRSTKSTSRSRAQSPEGPFSFLYSGRDDYQSASATSFRDLNSRSPYRRGSPQTQSQRYTATSPPPIGSTTTSTVQVHQTMQSPTRLHVGGQPRPAASRPTTSSAQNVPGVIVTTSTLNPQQDTSSMCCFIYFISF